MKPDTFVLITKAFCYVLIGAFTPLVSGLAQWADSGEWPSKIVWVILVSGCIVGGATQLLSFLSSSFSDYKQSRNGSFSGGPAKQEQPKSNP